MKKREIRKLALNKETLHGLSREQEQLINVAGGSVTCVVSCYHVCVPQDPTPR